jgi:protocatechuate 3,4-dioxygenase beta subunit
MSRLTRRRLLSRSLALGAGIMTAGKYQSLDQFLLPPCKDDTLTPLVPATPAFKPDAVLRTSLIEPGMTGSRIVLTGFVVGLKCGRIKGARVDFWQAEASGAYPQTGSRLRGRQATDAEGRYRLETVMPGAPQGRARHLSARVEPPGKPALTTELFFPDEPANAHDKIFKPTLVMKKVAGAPAGTFAYDFVLDL